MKKRIDKRQISVVIPLYNGEKTIGKVLNAIIHQINPEYIKEIIVVNDGSTDSSKEIVEKVATDSPLRIRLINTKNGGVSKARNVGLINATGNWIALCDSDDVWLPNKIEHQVSIINRVNSIDFLGGNHVDYDQRFKFRRLHGLKRITVKDLCLKTLPQTSTAIFKKSIFDKIGGYDENQKYAEDGNFFMKIAANYNYYYDSKQVVNYGDGKKGFGDSGLSANIDQMHEGLKKNIREMKQLGYISNLYCMFSLLIENCKFLRRKLIVKIR